MLEKIFQEFVCYVQEQGLALEGIAVADERRVRLEHRFTPDLTRNIYSHTKSYMATAVGMALSEGKLTLEDRLAQYFPEALPADPQPELFEITLRHLLTMSSGFGQAYLMNQDRRAGVGVPDYMKYMLSRPVVEKPGSAFCYSTADSILAGRMVERAVGCLLGEYLYDRLFTKLGQGFPQWETDPQGHPIGGGGMFMGLKDMMKLGQLYLADGCWKGERLVESAWVREATKKQIDTPCDNVWTCGYGYQFWMSPYPGAYRADGSFGQISMVLPSQGLVVAVQCPEWGDFDRVREAFHQRLFLPLCGL